MRTSRRAAILLLLLTPFAFAACGGGTAGTTPPAATGNVSVYLTDTPSYAFDNAWVTVTQVWFHPSDSAPFDNTTAAGWVRFTISGGATTINLAALSGDNNVLRIFDNLALAAGTYRQMLLFLEPTENGRTASAAAAGLAFNNQVDAGTRHAALRVPNAAQGIRVAGTFSVAGGALLRLAVDLNVGRDVLPFNRGTVQEFLLQPRPAVFDLDNAGAIVGFIDNVAAADNAAVFEVFGEQVVTDNATGLSTHVVRRAAAVDNVTGRFVLYPLVPGTSAAQRYDIVIRGIGWRTAIVKSVPVTAGTTPATGASLGSAAFPIVMTGPGSPVFRIGATITATTGALANFYQVLGTDPQYVIRQANFDPLSGTIANLALSNDQIDNAGFVSSGARITLSPSTPTGGLGTFRLAAEAPLFNASAAPGGGVLVDPTSVFSTPVVIGLSPAAPAVQTTVNATANLPSGDVALDNVVLFATFGGTILNARTVAPASSPITDGIANLPGGASGAAFPLASYGISAYGWMTSADNVLRIGPAGTLARTQSGDASVSFTMQRAP